MLAIDDPITLVVALDRNVRSIISFENKIEVVFSRF